VAYASPIASNSVSSVFLPFFDEVIARRHSRAMHDFSENALIFLSGK
jgi:hypothetical protein